MIAEQMLKEVNERLQFLLDVGLDYLSLNRSAARWPAARRSGSASRSQIGSGLVGVLYVLDEPSVGLHQRDNRGSSTPWCGCATSATRSSSSSTTRRRSGSPTTRRHRAGAGEHGGEIVFAGPVDEVCRAEAPSPASTWRASGRSRCRPARRAGQRLARRARRPRAQPARHRRRRSRSAASSSCPACPGRASPRSSTTSSSEALMQRIYKSQDRAGPPPTVEGAEPSTR